MKLLVATQNSNKIKEINTFITHDNVEIISLKDLNDLDDVLETGKTFKENALLKAKHFGDKYQTLTISDDSGLLVKALNNRPGINSKRYVGSSKENNLKILEELKNKRNRKAKMVTVITIYNPFNKTYKYFKGILKVTISETLKGDNGFGYDPLLYVKRLNKTLGEITIMEKRALSHRSKALIKLNKYLNKIKEA